ncbi:GAF domain-containing protein [Pendulispora albinea]|uniref:GAF domain-containing protein n=1 Tax=Pendulispora albinea TaxID=2741071 RepID=A0ABZ2LW61_9BACT
MTSASIALHDSRTVGIVGLPATSGRPWYVKETWPALAALFFAIVSGGFALVNEIYGLGQPNNPGQPSGHGRSIQIAVLIVQIASASALGLLKLAQSNYKDKIDEKKETPSDLRGPLHVLHRVIAKQKRRENPEEGWLRITVHRVYKNTKGEEELEQSVDYVGSKDGGAGRTFSAKSGLIGRVARLKEPRKFERVSGMSYDDWITYCVEHLGMTHEDARKTRDKRFSFIGVPISSGEKVRAVVYADSSEMQFFDEATTDLVLIGCAGLASFIDEHYYMGLA